MGATFIVCADPLGPRRADPHFAGEARAARELGHRVALIDHDALLAGDPAAAVAAVPPGAGPAWYRGWMVPTSAYTALDGALAERSVRLLTSSEAYRRAHELPERLRQRRGAQRGAASRPPGRGVRATGHAVPSAGPLRGALTLSSRRHPPLRAR